MLVNCPEKNGRLYLETVKIGRVQIDLKQSKCVHGYIKVFCYENCSTAISLPPYFL